MDIAMPVMTGEEAFWEIVGICQSKKWEVPAVIFCTGFTPPTSIMQAVRENPLHCYLPKPVRTENFSEAIAERFDAYDLGHSAEQRREAPPAE
jgi:CheY-like chemotaxis protein